MKEEVYRLISSQQNAFKENTLPKIADERIKGIEIHESGEPLTDIKDTNYPRISLLPDPTTPFASPDCNSGFPEGSKIRNGLYIKLELMVQEIDRLACKFGFKPGQISIKVFEGLRSVKTQEQLFNNKAKEIEQSHPEFTKEQVEQETSKWVSPVKNNVPVHSTGAAVDIRLYDENSGLFLDMGIFGAIWGVNPAAPTFSENISNEQMKNRLFLLLAANNTGLVNYPYEFWHFSTGDRYAAFWQQPVPLKAIYGGI